MANSAFSQEQECKKKVNVKLNAVVAVGVVNPAIEVRVMQHFSVQLEGLGIFAPRNFLGTGYPLSLAASFGEFRYYPKEVFKGFYCAANVGFGVYRMNKNVYPFKWGSSLNYMKDPRSVMVGQNLMAGATLGYVFTFKRNDHWGIEISWGLGWQGSTYEAYTPKDDGSKDFNHVELNGSGEWLPAYKGGVFISYRF
jgi:hypothetical protein